MPSPRLLAALAAVLAALASCDRVADESGPPPASESAPLEVRTALVAVEGFERSVQALGELAPYERVVLATKVPGRLAELAADRGDRVERGQVLATLEAREYEQRVRAAEAAVGSARAVLGLASDGDDDALDAETTAAVRLARAELERARLERERTSQLAREGVDSQALADRAEADFLAAESRLQEAVELVEARRAALAQRRAELEIARAQLQETTIEAPFDGAVERRLSATGAYLATGDPLLELVRLEPLRLVLEVGERDAAHVRAGQAVRARIEGHERELHGVVARLAPALSRDSRALVLEAEVADPEGALRPGSFAEARVVVAAEERALALPLEALVSFAGIDKAFVVEDGRTEERRIVVGRRERERVEVLSGLEAGDEVVLAPGKLGGGVAVRAAAK